MKEIKDKLMQSLDSKAETYFKKYKPIMESLERHSIKSKIKGINSYDYVALGRMLESFDTVRAMHEASGGDMNAMGILPQIAHDAIAVNYGSSPIALVASVQPIEEQNGYVYFRKTKGYSTKGNITAGDTIIDPKLIGKIPQSYANGTVANESLGVGDVGGTVSFSGTLAYFPVRGTLAVTLQDSTTVYCQDNGNGILLGAGVSGTINYTNKAFTLVFSVAPANTKVIYGAYYVNYESETTVPSYGFEYDTTEVKSTPFALQAEVGLFTNFGLTKRFGFSPTDQMALDLSQALSQEIMARIITQAVAQVPGANKTTFTKAVPSSNYAYVAHKYEFDQKIIDIENLVAASAGRGGVSAIIAGALACSVIAGLDGFDKVTSSDAGILVYGTYKNMPIIRVNDPTVLATGKALCVYKGSSPFDAALYYSPYLPIVTSELLPKGTNFLNQIRGVASLSAQGVMVPAFLGEITVS